VPLPTLPFFKPHTTPRHLSCAYLRFTPAERSFYNHILDKTAAAKQALEQEAAALEAAAAAAAATAVAAAAAYEDGDAETVADLNAALAAAASGSSRGRGGSSSRGAGGGGANQRELQALASDQIAQLRRACVHPQLTR
jgi:hypothetical protein